jgi:Cu+-exporting ATPase
MEETFGLKDYSRGTVERSKDPVCGRIIDETEAVAKTEWAGQTYYFCSTECQERFEQDPALFLGGPIT